MGIKVAKGIVCKVGTTTVAQVESASRPEITQEVQDVRTIDASVDYPQRVPTGITFGTIKLKVAYDPTLHAALDALANAVMPPGDVVVVEIDGAKYDCVAVSAGEVSYEAGNYLSREYTFTVYRLTPQQ